MGRLLFASLAVPVAEVVQLSSCCCTDTVRFGNHVSSHSQHGNVCGWTQHCGTSRLLCLWLSPWAVPATKLHPLQGGLVRLQGWPGALPKPLLGLFSELGSVLSPHARSHCVLGGIHAILCQNTDLLTGAFLRSNWARKHMSGFCFFPKAEVIPTHRAHSTGETMTTTCSHKNFSNSFAVFATVGGGFLGSLRCWGWSQPWG